MNNNRKKYYEFLHSDVIKADNKFLEELIEKACQNDMGKYRYCLHESEESNIQEMIFVNLKGTYAPPDKHQYCAETKIILYGEAWIILFQEDGEIREIILASAQNTRLCRVEKGIYHAVVPISEQVVFYEIREGRFTSDMTTYPLWAPKDASESEKKNYEIMINEAIRKWRHENVCT